ncbi:MAG: hypothetical protein HY329_26050 [Chloroflexi bacterium]|nr:hypothetical protein [Chloroflexota bacterium]
MRMSPRRRLRPALAGALGGACLVVLSLACSGATSAPAPKGSLIDQMDTRVAEMPRAPKEPTRAPRDLPASPTPLPGSRIVTDTLQRARRDVPLYVEPREDARRTGVAPGGVNLDVREELGDWVRVQFGFVQGWTRRENVVAPERYTPEAGPSPTAAR